MTNSLIIRLLTSGLMIIIGTAIYIISRENIIFFDWVPQSVMHRLSIIEIEDTSLWGYFIKYCLPDGLWYAALLIFQDTFLDKSTSGKIIYWICALLPFVWEIAQLHYAVSGTFDPMDLLVYLFVFIIFTLTCLFDRKI